MDLLPCEPMEGLSRTAPGGPNRRTFVLLGGASLAAMTVAPPSRAGLSDTLDTVAVPSSLGSAPNEVANPGFEATERSWTPSRPSGVTVIRDAEPQSGGTNALQITADGGSTSVSQMDLISVVPGEIWFGEVWIRADGLTGVGDGASINLSAALYSGETPLDVFSFFVQINPSDVTSTWQPYQGVITVPRDADSAKRADGMRVAVSIRGIASGAVRFDDVDVRRLPGPGLSVRDFGAIGDGATDDTVSLQAALDFSSRTQVPILAPAGRYAVTSVTLRERSALLGTGTETLRFPSLKLPGDDVYTYGGTSIVPARGAASPLVTIAGGGVTVRNVTLDGYNKNIDTAASGSDLVGLSVQGGFELRLDTVRVFRFLRTGIDVATMNNSTWSDVYVDNCGSSDDAAVVIRSGPAGPTNFCQFRGLTIERSGDMALAIAWGDDASSDYAEFLDIIGLHVEAARSGGGVLNTGPLIGIGNVTSVVLHAPQVLGAPAPIIEYRQQLVDNQNDGRPQEDRNAYVDPTGVIVADQLGGVTIVGGVIMQNRPTPAPPLTDPASVLLTSGSAVSLLGVRFLRTSTAAVEIASGFSGEVFIDPSTTNRPYERGEFVRDDRTAPSPIALRGPVSIGGHISTRSDAATVSAVGDGPSPIAVGGISDTRGSIAFGSNSAGTGPLVEVVFGRPYDDVPVVVVSSLDAKTQQLGLHLAVTRTGFTVSAAAGAADVPVAADNAGSAYRLNYLVIA